MDWGIFLTGFVFVLMLALMLVIGSLDRKIAQQKQRVVLADQEAETSAAYLCGSEA